MSGFWHPSSRDAQRMRRYASAAGGGLAAGADPYYAFAVSVLNFGGADASTTFTDEKGKTWTAGGDAQIDTSLGYNTGQFDGNDYIASAHSADWQLGTGDWAVEAWLVINSGVNGTFFTHFETTVTPPGGGLFFGTNAAGKLKIGRAGVADDLIGATVLPTGTLIHVAAAKISNTIYAAYNGSIDGSVANSSSYTSSGTPRAFIGAYLNGPSAGSNMRMRAFRLTKGSGRGYSSTFSPPSPPFPGY